MQKCEELGVTLTDDQVTTVDTQLAQVWEQRGETFRDNGISEDSIRCILEYTYYATDLFLYYYDVDAAEGVKDSEVQDFYAENNARVRYITFNLKDGNGEALTDSKDIQNMKDMVNGYCDDVKKCTSEEDKLAKFNDIQSEYNAYVTSLSEEAAGATTSSDAASGTTTTTTAGETDAAQETEAAAQTTVAAEMHLLPRMLLLRQRLLPQKGKPQPPLLRKAQIRQKPRLQPTFMPMSRSLPR